MSPQLNTMNSECDVFSAELDNYVQGPFKLNSRYVLITMNKCTLLVFNMDKVVNGSVNCYDIVLLT